MGFDGKTLIHPAQIGPANIAFAGTPARADGGRKNPRRLRAAGKCRQGGAFLDGRMVERLHLAQAEKLLARAAAMREADAPLSFPDRS